jgi:beta-glucosidase-like glycosyl hydrolase
MRGRRAPFKAARHAIVLLKNEGMLPLPADKPLHIAVIGGHAQEGVPTGTGSSAVIPIGGYAGVIKIGGPTSGRNGSRWREARWTARPCRGSRADLRRGR